MNSHLPRINFVSINFPSDALTIRQLRGTYPRSFDIPRDKQDGDLKNAKTQFLGIEGVESSIGGLIECERRIAALAFEKAADLPMSNEVGAMSQKELIECLVSYYVDLGIAKGSNHAHALIRNIESQAKAQIKDRKR